MANLNKTWSAAEIRALCEEIDDFIKTHPDAGELESVFARDFHRSYRPEAFGMTSREFLAHVLAALR